MSEKEKERGEALAPKEKKRVIMDKTPMYYFLAKYNQKQNYSKVKAIQGQYINFSNYGKEILLLLCMVIGKKC